MLKKILTAGLLLAIMMLNIKTLSHGDWGRVDIAQLQEQYDHSQYCVPRCEFRGNIDDPELYTLAGYRYLQGVSPSDLNPELQPLTKYLFGLSTHLFGTPLPSQLLFGVLALLLLTILARRVLSSPIALIPALLLSLDPLFQDQLIHPYLDLSVAMWVLVMLYLLTHKQYRHNSLYLGLTLGALALSKSFSLGALGAVMLIPAFGTRYWSYLRVAIVGLVTYLVGYLPVLLQGGVMGLVYLHIDTLRLYRSYVPEYPKGEIMRIIFLGEWRTWWGDKGLIPSPFYSWLWPASTLATIFAFTKKKLRDVVSLHLFWVILALAFISLRLVFPRYLLPALPSLYLIMVIVIRYIIHSCRLSFSPSTSKPTVTSQRSKRI